MEVSRLCLCRDWEFSFADAGVINSLEDCRSLKFRPATVPGTNLEDLQSEGLVEKETDAGYEASFLPFAEKDFIYRTVFSGAEMAGAEHVSISFEGIDTVCLLWLNGSLLADTDNAFTGYRYDITGRLKPGENELVALFRSPLRETRERRKRMAIPNYNHVWPYDFMYLRKPAYSFFWDWGPSIPVSGMYRPVYLESWDKAVIRDFRVDYTLDGRKVSGRVEAQIEGDASLPLVLNIGGREFTGKDGVVDFSLDDVRLWYPNGEGEPYLYDMKLSLFSGGNIIDHKEFRTGFRNIELVQDARKDGKGTRFVFKVNGREVFARGYNWIPVDNSVPRSNPGRYEANLDLAKDSGVNMLRVWGGGYYEEDDFYRMCDERGIMVWQDGAFACAMYPDHDEGFMASLKGELEYNIKRLRNYTSLALWCGNNENHWAWDDGWNEIDRHYGVKIYDELFPSLVKDLDPGRLYWNSSPWSCADGTKANDQFCGDHHYWDLHTNCGDMVQYAETSPSFVSETGLQSFPDLKTALSIGSEADRHVQSYLFDTRNHFMSTAKNERLLKFAGSLFRVSDNFDEMVILSNLAHGEYLRYAVEHWRTQAYDCGGVLLWQLNDCWPAISWSAVDYYLQPKACYYYMKRAYAKELVVFRQTQSCGYKPDEEKYGELFVISDRDDARDGKVVLSMCSLSGKEQERMEFPIGMQGRGVLNLGRVELPGYAGMRFDGYLHLGLQWDDGTGAESTYTLSRPKYMRLANPGIRIVNKDDKTLLVEADAFVKGVYLYHPDLPAVFSDNYFDIVPSRQKMISVTVPVNARDIKVFVYHNG